MRISYRAVSSLVVTALVLISAIGFLFDKSPVSVPTTVSGTGIVQFDPCMMLDQIPASVRLDTFVWCGSFLALLVQGMRNRSAPRWLALVCLVALGPIVSQEYWRLQHCYTKLGTGIFWIWISAVSLMCLHQILQRPPLSEKGGSNEPPQGKGGMTPPAKSYKSRRPSYNRSSRRNSRICSNCRSAS
jgi:hypothetical protein